MARRLVVMPVLPRVTRSLAENFLSSAGKGAAVARRRCAAECEARAAAMPRAAWCRKVRRRMVGPLEEILHRVRRAFFDAGFAASITRRAARSNGKSKAETEKVAMS